MIDQGINIDNYNLDGLIGDLRSLAEYLTDVPPESMRSTELQVWHKRLKAVGDFLRCVEIKRFDNEEAGDWDDEGGEGEAGGEGEEGGEGERGDEADKDDEGGEWYGGNLQGR